MLANQLTELNSLIPDVETFISAAEAQGFNCTQVMVIASDNRSVNIWNDGPDPDNAGKHILRVVANPS